MAHMVKVKRPKIRRPEKKLDLTLEIRNFGPITEGKLKIRPFTVFIGPNNSGKSYVAMLIHSLLQSSTSVKFGRRLPFSRRTAHIFFRLPITDFLSNKVLKELYDFLEHGVSNLREEKSIDIPEVLIGKIINALVDGVYKDRFAEEIIRSYSASLIDLVKIGAKKSSINVEFNSKMFSLELKKDLKIKEYPSIDFRIKIESTDISSENDLITKEKNGKDWVVKVNIGWLKEDVWRNEEEKEETLSDLIDEILDEIFDICTHEIVESLKMASHYLPAARSGILQSHRIAAAEMMRKVTPLVPFVGIEKIDIDIPKFSGVVAEFMASILELPRDEGAFYSLAEKLERELIKGEIVVLPLDSYMYPSEIQYRYLQKDIPLHRSSSTVSELAPLILYLKYIVEPGSVLIIEEPEAHLHPKNQRILARFLVKLVRRGVNIIITTHSEYLLEQLSNFIMLGKIEAKDRVKRYGYDEEDYLTMDDIAGYVFEVEKRSGGSIIKEVEITEEDGISQEEFIKIQDVLYDEVIKLRKDLSVE